MRKWKACNKRQVRLAADEIFFILRSYFEVTGQDGSIQICIIVSLPLPADVQLMCIPVQITVGFLQSHTGTVTTYLVTRIASKETWAMGTCQDCLDIS